MADKKQIILGVGLDSTDVKQGTEEISRSVNKMAGDIARESIQAGKAVSKIGDEALSSAEDFSKAESKIIQSIQRRTAALEAAGKGARAYQEALISNRGLDPAKFDAYLSKLDAADKATQRLGQTTANVGSGVSGQFSNNLRNASFQIQDFAVQVNGGVDATKALAMQLPQMLVGFGTAGAVIGVFAALLPNLITLMGGVGDGSKKLSDAIGDLDKAIGDVGSTVKTFDMDGLYEQFNNANKATQAAIVGQLEFQRVFLETSRLVASKKFGEEIGGLGSFGTLDKLAGAYASSGSEKLAKQLGVSLDVAKDLLPVLNGLKNGTEDVNNAFSRFGTSLLSGNAESRALASSMASLAKSERDAAAASSAISEAQEKMAKGHVTTKKELEAANKAQKDHNTELEKFQALMDKINGKDTGLDAGYWKDLEALHNAYGKGRLNIEQYRDAVGKLTMAQKFYTDQLKQQADVEASRAKYLGNIEKETEELVKKAEAAELENARIGMTTEQLEELNRKRYESQIAILSEKAAAIEAMGVRNEELDYIEKQIDALRRLQSAEVARPKLQSQAREWEKFTDQIGQSLTDALYRAFESGEGFGKSFAKTLENTLKATFAKLLINTAMTTGSNLTNTAINSILGTSSANGGAGTNYFGLASNASSIYNLASGTYLGYAQAAQAGYGLSSAEAAAAAQAYYNAGYYGTGAAIQAGNVAGTGTLGSTSAAGSAGASTGAMSLGAAAGYMAIIAAVFQLLTTSKTRYLDTNITGTLGPDGLTNGMIGDRYKYTGNLLDAGGTDLEWRPLTSNQAEYDEFYMRMRFGNYRNNAEALQSAGYLGDNIDSYTLQRVPYTQEQIDAAFAKYVADQESLDMRINRTGSGETVATELEQGGALKAAFEAIYKGAKASLESTAKLFGDDSLGDALKGYVSQINIKTSGSISDAIGKYADDLISGMGAAWLPTVESLRQTTESGGKKITETWSQAFNRLLTEATAVSGVFDLLGNSLAEIYGNNTDKILSASDAFVKLFGTVDQLNASVSAYYENFYTEEEKKAKGLEALGKQFAALNLEMPKTRAEFVALVDAQLKLGDGGAKTFKSLMDLQGTFATLVPAISTVETAVESLATSAEEYAAEIRQSIADGFDAQQSNIFATAEANYEQLRKAVELEKQRVTAAKQAAQEQISAIKSLTNYLDGQISSILGGSSASGSLFASSQAFISQAAANARNGYLPDQAQLSDAVGIVRNGLQSKIYTSAAEKSADALRLAAELSDISKAGKRQLPIAEKSLKVAEDQLENLDKSLEYYRNQLDELKGIRKNVLDSSLSIDAMGKSIVEQFKTSIGALTGSILSAMQNGNINSATAAQKLAAAGVPTDLVTLVGGKPAFVSSQGAIATSDGMITANNGWKGSIDAAKQIVAQAFEEMPPADFYAAAKKVGLSAAMIEGMYNLPGGTANAWAASQGLPSFAIGTNYVPRDMVANIHEGEAIVPKAYNPAAGGVGNTERLENLVEALTTEVQRLQGLVNEGNRYAERSATVLDDASKGRNPIQTEAVV